MSFNKIQRIPSKDEVVSLLPLDDDLKHIRQQNDLQIKNILSGNDSRRLIIIGPCSADNESSILNYLDKLSKINGEVKDKLFIVPRIYTGKPRTTGDGYKGMIHQPNINDIPNMRNGIFAIRRLDLRILRDYHFPIADEMLYTSTYPFISDLLSYVAIGARSVENQQHRLVSSGIPCSVGMKNPMSGDISVMLNAINTSQSPHNFIYENYEVNTSGNPYSHGILRGFVNIKGEHFPNYHYNDLVKTMHMYDETTLNNKSIIIDTNHSNSAKMFHKQPSIAYEVLHSMNKNSQLNKLIKGFMIESYIEEGSDPTGQTYGKSITDPCISIGTTRELLLNIAYKCK